MPRVRPSGLSVSETITGALTVIAVEPMTAPRVAEMVVVPDATPLAKPLTSTVATDGVDEPQLTSAVRSRLLPSLYVPVAVNCWVVFIGMDNAAGATVIAVKLAAATVTRKLAVAFTVPEVAVMFTTPLATPLARPLALIETTPASEEFHRTEAVMSWLLPSENVPVAENCWVAPGEIDPVPGEICSPVKVTGAGVGVGIGVGVGVGAGVGVGIGVGAGVAVGVGETFGVGLGVGVGGFEAELSTNMRESKTQSSAPAFEDKRWR